MQTIQYLKVLVQFEASEAIPVLFQNEAKVNFHFLLLLHESCLAPETRSCFEYLFFHLTFSAFDFFLVWLRSSSPSLASQGLDLDGAFEMQMTS